MNPEQLQLVDDPDWGTIAPVRGAYTQAQCTLRSAEARKKTSLFIALLFVAGVFLAVVLNVINGQAMTALALWPVVLIVGLSALLHQREVISDRAVFPIFLAVILAAAAITAWPNGGMADPRSVLITMGIVTGGAALLGREKILAVLGAAVAFAVATFTLQATGAIDDILWSAPTSELQRRLVSGGFVLMNLACLGVMVRHQRFERGLLLGAAEQAMTARQAQADTASHLTGQLRAPMFGLFSLAPDIQTMDQALSQRFVTQLILMKSRANSVVAQRLSEIDSNDPAVLLNLQELCEQYATIWKATGDLCETRVSVTIADHLPSNVFSRPHIIDLILDFWVTEVIWRWPSGQLEVTLDFENNALGLHARYQGSELRIEELMQSYQQPRQVSELFGLGDIYPPGVNEQPILLRRIIERAGGHLDLDLEGEGALSMHLRLPAVADAMQSLDADAIVADTASSQSAA